MLSKDKLENKNDTICSKSPTPVHKKNSPKIKSYENFTLQNLAFGSKVSDNLSSNDPSIFKFNN